MSSYLSSSGDYRYEKVGSLSDGLKKTKTPSSLLLFVAAVPLVAISFFCGYVVGNSRAKGPLYGAVPIDSVDLSFTYNNTFTLPPTNHTNAAWDQIFPDGAGFITHPELSPNVSGIAVFHQLHCLNQIRIGYYNANQTVESHDPEFPNQPAHTRHCFDYLRQSLMCASDSNIEPVNSELGGVTGWGNMRVCRSYEQLVQWAEKWKAGNESGAGLNI